MNYHDLNRYASSKAFHKAVRHLVHLCCFGCLCASIPANILFVGLQLLSWYTKWHFNLLSVYKVVKLGSLLMFSALCVASNSSGYILLSDNICIFTFCPPERIHFWWSVLYTWCDCVYIVMICPSLSGSISDSTPPSDSYYSAGLCCRSACWWRVQGWY